MARTAPRLSVTLDDGTEHDVQTAHGDLIRWELTRERKKWPALDNAPILWGTFLAWSALHRAGVIPEDVEPGLYRIEDVGFLTDDGTPVGAEDAVDADDVGARPTNEGHTPTN